MTLTETLKEAVAGSAARIPLEIRETMMAANEEIIATGIENTALKAGDTAPDFTLKNASGQDISLADRLKTGPVVIVFYRGGWCPYCNLELKAYQQELDAIQSLGASLIAISPEAPDNSLTTAEKNELTFDVLSDEGFAVADAFGLTFTFPEALVKVYEGFGLNVPQVNGDTEWRLPIPAAYIVGQDGTITLHHVDVNYTERLDPIDVLAKLREMKA